MHNLSVYWPKQAKDQTYTSTKLWKHNGRLQQENAQPPKYNNYNASKL